jgi:hypothetical protein
VAQRKPVSQAEPVIIRNIDELTKTIPKGKLLIHLTQQQWANLTKGMKSSKVPPKRGIVFRYTPFPDGSGGLGSPECVAQVCELCSVRLGRGPDGSIGMQCRCRPDPSPECREHHVPSGGQTGTCSLALRQQLGRWQLTCQSVNCSGNCRMVAIRQPTNILISCACQ